MPPEPSPGVEPSLGVVLGGFFALLALAFGLQIAGFVLFGLILWRLPPAGLGFAVSLLLAAPVVAAATWWAARRWTGDATAYLGWRLPSWRAALGWAVVTALAVVGLEGVRRALGEPVVADFVAEIYATAGNLPLFYVSLCILAVGIEELLFRGILLPGLAAHWGAPAAVGLSSLAFAGVHAGQYGWVDLAVVFVLGLILGAARWQTGSLPLAVGLHGAVNLTALIQAHRALAL